MMDHCCGVARPQQGPSSASICTHCHVILPFRTHCHFILPNTGPSPGTFTLIGTDLRPWRCHFVLQVTDTPVSPLVATYAKMRIQGFEPSFGREYRVARFPDASGMSLRAEGCSGQWCRHAARLGCMLAASRSVAGIVLAYLGDDGQTKIAEVFVESSWTTLQKLRWFEMGETILIHVSARVDQPEHELGRRCGCGKT